MDHPSQSEPPLETAHDYSLLGGEHLERGRRLFTTGVILLAAALIYLGYEANTDSSLHIIQGLLIFSLAVLPSLLWARSGGSRFPVFETIMMLCANAYAIPMLNAREQLAGFGDEVITRSGWAVLLYLVCANATYFLTRGEPGRGRFWVESLISPQVEKMMVYGMTVSTLYILASVFTNWIPAQLISPLRAVFFGLGILCTFIGAQRWGRDEMTAGEQALFAANLILQMAAMSVSLVLISALSLIGIGMLGYLSGGKRIPWLLIGATFIVISVLHNGKTRMREKYWEIDYPQPTISQVPAFYAEWFEHGLEPSEGNKTASRKLLERTSLMHILCLIDAYTPSRQDYLYGSTYRHVVTQLIPRFFWPDKPRSHIATYELSIYYGLQREEDTEATTIAFGLLAEAYANFGFFGSVLLGLFWGITLKKMQIWSTFSPMFSFAGLLMVLLTAWGFSAELTMAAWVSSLEQAVLVVLGIPWLIKTFFGG
jgi:hypothetical protein